MKKFTLLLTFIITAFSLFSQAPFQIVNWINLNEDVQSPYYNFDLSSNPFDKKAVVAVKLSDSSLIDIPNMDLNDLKTLWDSLGNEQYISQPLVNDEGDLFDLGSGNTFGASFKACFDSDNLYIMLKYVDKNRVFNSAMKRFEVMIQTKEPDRYEAGFDAAEGLYGPHGTNAQYGRYIELGGSKFYFGSGGFYENTANCGQDGTWRSGIQAMNVPETLWQEDSEGTAWAILRLNFSGNMAYMADEWGAYNSSNYVAFDPKVKKVISFDIRSDATDNDNVKRTDYCWNSTNNEVYCLNYYAGYLVFDEDAWVPRPVVISPVYYCTGEPSSPLQATGDNLRWYTKASGGTPYPDPVSPPTEVDNVMNYYVSQVVNGVESDRAKIKVNVTNLQADILGDSMLSCHASQLFVSFNNYKGESDISSFWEYQDQVFNQDSLQIDQFEGDSPLVLKVQTNSGCQAEDTLKLTIIPSANPLLLELAGYDQQTGKNMIRWTKPGDVNIDSLFIFRSVAGEDMTLLGGIVYNPGTDSYIDLNSNPANQPYSYLLKLKDECGTYSESSGTQKTMRLDVFQNMNSTVQLLWDTYQGRTVEQYNLLKGHSPQNLINTGHISPLQYSWYDDLSLDTVWYQVEAKLSDENGKFQTTTTLSNTFRFNPQILVFDTIWVETCSGNDTLKIDAGTIGDIGPEINYIKVYPNPSQGIIVIDLGNYTHYSTCTLRIIDTMGREIFNRKCNQAVYEINLSEFGEKGMYYLQFLNPENTVLDTKIIVLQ